MKKQIIELIKYIIYILMGLQILLGILWAISNITKVPNFQQSIELFQMSSELLLDEYTGILYPLLIKAVQFVTKYIPIPACTILYILQLGVAYMVYEEFLAKVVFVNHHNIRIRKQIRFFAGYVLTIPVVLQVHMAVLPYSLASSLAVYILTKLIGLYRISAEIKVKEYVKLALWWLICGQLCIDYIWLFMIPMLIWVVSYAIRNKKLELSLLILVVLVLTGNSICNSAFQTKENTGKIQNSWEAAMLKRVVWPNFSRFSYFWKEEIRETWDDAELLVLSTYPEKVIYDFGPTIDEMFGREEANSIYRQMIGRSFELDTKQIVLSASQELVAYICTPVSTYLQLKGMGSSYAGWNYGRMKDYTPRLTGIYVEISLSSWIFIVILLLMSRFFILKEKEWLPLEERKYRRWTTGYLLTTVVWVSVWYVIVSAHMQDYLKVPMISVIWTFGMIAVLIRTEKSGS